MKKAILLIYTGTPTAATPKAIKKYLFSFLSDKRILPLQSIIKWCLLKFIILPKRSPVVAKKYQSIWQKEGSPLLVYATSLTSQLTSILPKNILILLGMRYGNSNIRTCLNEIKKKGVEELLLLPLFPQYASATIGSILEVVYKEIANWQNIPQIKLFPCFGTNSDYLALLAKQYTKTIEKQNRKKNWFCVFTFHSLPMTQAKASCDDICCFEKGNICLKAKENNKENSSYFCYKYQAYSMVYKLVKLLSIPTTEYSICFQSKFGKTSWLMPSLEDTVKKYIKEEKENICIFPLSFPIDCLETQEEISIEVTKLFERERSSVCVIPALNDSFEFAQWIATECLQL